MVSLLELKTFAESNKLEELNTINNYINMSKENWSNGKFYLGGQIPIELNSNITDDHFTQVDEKNKKALSPYNSIENMSMIKSRRELKEMKDIIKKYKQNVFVISI